MKATTLVTLALLLLFVGCTRRPRVEVVDLSVARLPANAEIAIDGSAHEAPWEKAAVMPFEKTGEAKFLWDEKRIYGSVRKYEHQMFGLGFDELLCVSIGGERGRIVKLFFEQEHLRMGRSALVLREAYAADHGAETSTRQVLPRDSVAFAGGFGLSQCGCTLSVEFSIDWAAVSGKSPAGQRVSIHVYRLVPQLPITHIVGMGHTAKKAGGQDGPAE